MQHGEDSGRIEQEIETLGVHLRYLEAKAGLWDARDRGDTAEEPVSALRVNALLDELEAVMP